VGVLGINKDTNSDSKQASRRSESEESSTVARSKMEEILRRRLDSVKGQVGIVFTTVK
jgi:hypothetical protein